jgi:RNA polymerase sigma-70 factor (ECF subfamily)
MTLVTASERTAEFVELLSASSRSIFSFILSLLPSWADTEEVYQDVCRTLWEKFDEYQPGTNFTAWACQVAFHKARKARERQQRGPALFSDLFIDEVGGVSVEEELLDGRQAALHDCLKKLSDRDRVLITRRYRGELMPAKIAEQDGLSVSAIHKALSRIHQLLFDCIERAMRREGSP